jgi:hypothetical protein
MIDPGLLAATSWTSAGPALGGIATFFILFVLPAAWFFHRKVIRPLSFVLGLKAEESPTGEPIPSIPVQLADMRKNQIDFRTVQAKTATEVASIKAELHPNSGHSMRDVTDRTEASLKEVRLQVVDVQTALERHLVEEQVARQAVSDLASRTAAELAAVTAKTASDLAVRTVETATEVARVGAAQRSADRSGAENATKADE